MLEVIVPATSANIGPGYDCLGIALNLYNKFYFCEIEKGLIIDEKEEEYINKDNLVYKSMMYFFDKIKPKKISKGIKIKIVDDVPISRGLGSSATCIVAGLLAANYLSNSHLDKSEILKLATEIEGHPDNVTPALYGNMIIFNVSRATLLVTAFMNKNLDLLKIACKDKFHQDYRSPLIKDYDKVVNHANKLNSLGTFLSGAGPTIMSLTTDDDTKFIDEMESFLSTLDDKWIIKDLHCDLKGARVNILD